MEGFWLYFFQLWLKAVALMGPGVENCSTIRGHFNFITCLVDLTKILNHTRRHFPNLEQPPFDRAADIRDTAAVRSWFSTLGRTVESTIIKATACTYFQSLLNVMFFMTACSKKVYDQRRGMLSNMQKRFPLTAPHILSLTVQIFLSFLIKICQNI